MVVAVLDTERATSHWSMFLLWRCRYNHSSGLPIYFWPVQQCLPFVIHDNTGLAVEFTWMKSYEFCPVATPHLVHKHYACRCFIYSIVNRNIWWLFLWTSKRIVLLSIDDIQLSFRWWILSYDVRGAMNCIAHLYAYPFPMFLGKDINWCIVRFLKMTDL